MMSHRSSFALLAASIALGTSMPLDGGLGLKMRQEEPKEKIIDPEKMAKAELKRKRRAEKRQRMMEPQDCGKP